MKFTIAQDNLVSGLQALQGIGGHRSTLPILSNVLIVAENDRLELTATDLDVTITRTVPAHVPRPGQVTLPLKKLFSLVRELPPGDIGFDVDDKCRCSIRVGASYYKIHGLAAEEYPPIPRFKDERKVVVEQKKLREMLRRTSFAASTDEARYVLNGIFFSIKEHKLTLVATDGRRLALVEEDVDILEAVQGDFIVPTKAVVELSRLLGDAGQIEIQYADNQASFSLRAEGSPPTQMVTKLVEGNYPNYRQVIPSETKVRVQVPREEFLHALRRAEIMTSEKQNSVKLAFKENSITISTDTPEVGEGEERIAVKYAEREMLIAFNPRFIIQALEVLEDQGDVMFDFVDELAPGVIRVNGPFLYVVMPMRIN